MNLNNEIAEYISQTDDLMAGYKATIEKQAAELESLKSGSQKEASVSGPVLDTQAVDQMVSKCVEAGFIKEAEEQLAKDAVLGDANKLVDWVEKLASKAISEGTSVPSLGRPAAKTEKYAAAAGGAVRESDRLFEERFGA